MDVSWKFLSSNHYLKSKSCQKIGDEVHLNENGIDNLKNCSKITSFTNCTTQSYDEKVTAERLGASVPDFAIQLWFLQWIVEAFVFSFLSLRVVIFRLHRDKERNLFVFFFPRSDLLAVIICSH